MFRSKKFGFVIYSRPALIEQMSSASVLRTPHFRTLCCRPTTEKSLIPDEGSLIPEHLRYKNESSYIERLKQFMKGDSGPVLPMGIILVGAHVWFLWYLFGGEFESDMEFEEPIPYLSASVSRSKALYRRMSDYIESKTFGLASQGQQISELESNQTKN